MEQLPSSLDVLILGRIVFDTTHTCSTLTIVASFGQNRTVERIELGQSIFKEIDNSTNNVRAFVESGTPNLGSRDFEKLGGALFDLVFRGRIRELFSFATAAHTGPLLPCEITCEDAQLARWPWEYLFNSTQPQFLCEESHPVTRKVITIDRRMTGGKDANVIRILFALGVKQEDPRITPKEEHEGLKRAFHNLLADDSFSFNFIELDGATPIDEQLDANPCDILHFFGHAGFDPSRDEGYLRIDRAGKPFKLWANLLGQTLRGRNIRLVFLNACKTAESSLTVDPARSGVAGGLHARGIPIVIGTQFSMPDLGSHFFSSTFYNMLAQGKTVAESIHRARRAMKYSEDGKFFDWGIPVLYCSHPGAVMFPKAKEAPWVRDYERMSSGVSLVSELSKQSVALPLPISVATAIDPKARDSAKFRVGLVDIDAKAGFLPQLIEQANSVQSYYSFRIVYIPIPAGYVRNIGGQAQTYVPNLAEYLVQKKVELGDDFLCCLTKNLIAGDGYWNFFASAEETGGSVSCISTYNVREYAQRAGTSFAKACLSLCLSMLLMGDTRWKLSPHNETHGCLFDLLMNRNEIIVGLSKMKFDHQFCRKRIKDAKQLKAIDVLLALPNS